MDKCQEMRASWDGGIRGLSAGIRGELDVHNCYITIHNFIIASPAL